MPDEPAYLANSTKLVVAATDYLRDVGLHRQLTIKMDPEVTNGLQRTDHRSMKCHLIFFPYRPGLTSMQHAALHMTAVQPPSQSGLVKKYKCARLKFSTTKAGSCQTGETLTKEQWRDSSVLVVAVQSCDVVTHTDNEADCCCARRRHDLGTVRNQLDE